MKKFLVATLALSMLVPVARANDGHGAPVIGPPPVFDINQHVGQAIVGSDGSIYITNTTGAPGALTTKVVAVRPTGTIAWTSTIQGGAALFLSGTNLIHEMDVRATDGTVTTTLTAISTASGSVAWTRTLNGRASLEPFNGGTYAILEVRPTTTGGTVTRSLTGIGNDGSVLFTLTLP